MGTVLASVIVDKAELILQDSSNVRWTADELLGWLNDGQRAIVALKPDAAQSMTAAVVLVEGTLQTRPAGSVVLENISHNMGADGTTAGQAITLMPIKIMNDVLPDWHTHTASATVKHWLRNPKDPETFYVYPPQPASASGYVQMVNSNLPADVAAVENAITLDDVWQNALLDHIMYRAFSREAGEGNRAKADAHFRAFVFAVKGKDAGEKEAKKKLEEGSSAAN